MSLILPPDAEQDNEPKLVAKNPNCTMCKHFDKQPTLAPPHGYCVRFPPTVQVIGMQPGALAGQMVPVTNQFAPTVGPNFACGEFSPNQENTQ